jgi:DNA-binding LacI/PurR family transcriptional regulator
VVVPRDVSVIGFDDVTGAAHFSPSLTTVRQDFGALGGRCMPLLVAAMGGHDLDPSPIPPRLVVRASTGAAGA